MYDHVFGEPSLIQNKHSRSFIENVTYTMPRNAVPLCKQHTKMDVLKFHDVLANLVVHYFRII
jgi:hypothetical protein